MTALHLFATVAWNPGESPRPKVRPGTRRMWTRIVLAVLAVLGSWTALAQDSALAAPLSLSEARKLAFLRNWDLLAARSDVDLAVAQGIVARQFPNPVLSLAESKISVDRAHGSSTPSGNGYFNRSYDTVAAVSQLIEIGGKRTARRDSARAGEAAARERFNDARRLLELGVTRAYVDALQTDESARILANSAAALFQEASLARLRVRAGDISTNDGTQIEIAAERLQLDAARAASDSTNARIRLATLLGEKTPVASLAFADSLDSLGRSGAPSPGLGASPGFASAMSARSKSSMTRDIGNLSVASEQSRARSVSSVCCMVSSWSLAALALPLPLLAYCEKMEMSSSKEP
jgi:cobalt-zinc-cadmium efflux system outer membrane protein